MADVSLTATELTVLGTVGGALIVTLGNALFSEHYKRYRERKALAAALAGELATHLGAITEETLKNFEILAAAARAKAFHGFPEFDASDLVLEKNVERLGLLDGDLPERVVTVYGHIRAARGALQRIARGAFADRQDIIAATFDYHIKQFREKALPEGKQLVTDLRLEATRAWWR
jgi:hypothetical protein